MFEPRRCLLPVLMLIVNVCTLLSLPDFSQAQNSSIKLDGVNPARHIGKRISYIEDTSRSLDHSTALAKYHAGEFELRTQSNIDFGYGKKVFWLAIPFENTTTIAATYLLSTNWQYVYSLSAFLVLPNQPTERIVEITVNTKLSDARFSGRSYVSEQFLVPGKTSGLIMARFENNGFGFFPLSLETPQSAFELASLHTVGFAGFYGAAIASGIIFMLFIIAIRHAGGVYFLGIIVSGLLIMAQLDGYLFYFLWPNWPQWDRVVSFPILLFVDFTSFALASYMFRSSETEVWAKWTRIFMWISPTPLLLWPFFAAAWLIPIGFVLLIMAMGSLVYANFIWAQLLPRKRQLGIAFGTLMLIIVAAVIWSIATGIAEVNIASHNLIKVLYTIMVVFSMIAYATHISALNRNYAKSLERELALARSEAQMNADLLASERKFAEAQELVASHKHRLATTSHDLKQPIASLRLTLDAMAKSGGKEVEGNVARAFDYLEDLVNENLQEGTDFTPEKDEDKSESISLDLIFETTVQMFNEEAISKGIRLTKQPSELEVEAEVVPLMRILNNLVSNSVKHTQTGGVEISARSNGENVLIDVTDTGPGMSKEEIATFSTLYAKGKNSEGNGMGLPICFELAEKLGMKLSITSTKGEGSRFHLKIPGTKPE